MRTIDPNSSEQRVVVNATTGYADKFISLAIRFFLTPYLGRTLGATMMGLQTLAGQVLQFVALASTSLNVSYTRIAAEYHARGEYDEMNATLSAGFLLACLSATIYAVCTALTIVFTPLLFGLSPELVPVARLVIGITGLAAALHMVYGVWLSPVFITQRLYLRSIGDTVAIAGAAGCVLIAFRAGSPSIIVWVLLMAGFRVGTELLLVMPMARRKLPQMRVSVRSVKSRRQLRRVISFGGLSFLGGVGYLLYYATDSIVISNLDELDASRIFYYNIAQRWDPVIRSLIMALVSVLTPLMTSDLAVGNITRVRRTLLRGTRYSLAMGIFPCIVLIVLGHAFIDAWMKADYASVSFPVLRIVMTGFLVGIPGMVAFELLLAHGRIGRAVTATLVGGAINVVLSVFFVKVAGLGLSGIALGSVLTLGFVNGVYVPWQAVRSLDISPGVYLREGMLRSVLGGALLLGLCLAVRAVWSPARLVSVFVQFGLCGIAYAGIVWRVSLTRADRETARRALRRLWAGAKSGWRE